MDELDRVQVTRPCPLAKDPVGPGGGHCDHCQETVVDLSRMPRAEAVALVRAGSRCVRMERGPDGRVRTLVRAAAVATALAACAPAEPFVAEQCEQVEPESPAGRVRVVDQDGLIVQAASVHEMDPLSDPSGACPTSLRAWRRVDRSGVVNVPLGVDAWVEARSFRDRPVGAQARRRGVVRLHATPNTSPRNGPREMLTTIGYIGGD